MNRRLRFCALILFIVSLTFLAAIAQALPPEDTQIEEPDSYTHCGAVDRTPPASAPEAVPTRCAMPAAATVRNARMS